MGTKAMSLMKTMWTPPVKNADPQQPGQHADGHPEDSGEILPPGKLRREDGDSALTGITRSLQRRVLGLRVLPRLRDLAKRHAGQSATPPEKPD